MHLLRGGFLTSNSTQYRKVHFFYLVPGYEKYHGKTLEKALGLAHYNDVCPQAFEWHFQQAVVRCLRGLGLVRDNGGENDDGVKE